MHYRRVKLPNHEYFFTLALHDRNSSLLTKHVKELRGAFIKIKKKLHFELEAVVILPDHLHMLMMLPRDETDYSQRINLIKGAFCKAIPSQKQKIWQNRFWEHTIRDEQDHDAHINYIHNNPVKHGYVQHADEWIYSSVHRYIRQGMILPSSETSINEYVEPKG